MNTNLSYVRSLAPETPSWVHEQIAVELDRRDAEIEKLIEAEKLLLTITTDLLEKLGIDGLLPEYDEACKMLKEAKSLMNEQYGNEKTK